MQFWSTRQPIWIAIAAGDGVACGGRGCGGAASGGRAPRFGSMRAISRRGWRERNAAPLKCESQHSCRAPFTSIGFYLPVFGVLRSHGNRAVITFWYIVARPTLPEGSGRSPRMRLG